MPCNSDYLEPTQAEENRKKVCRLIVFVDNRLGLETVKSIIDASNHVYGEGVDLDRVVKHLCHKLSNLSAEEEEAIIYDARNKTSRELADWWEEHLEADRKRLQKDLDNEKHELAYKAILDKLTPHERRVLGL